MNPDDFETPEYSAQRLADREAIEAMKAKLEAHFAALQVDLADAERELEEFLAGHP